VLACEESAGHRLVPDTSLRLTASALSSKEKSGSKRESVNMSSGVMDSSLRSPCYGSTTSAMEFTPAAAALRWAKLRLQDADMVVGSPYRDGGLCDLAD